MSQLRRSLRLDESLWTQFWGYVTHPFNNEVLSVQFRQPVYSVIWERFWPTVLLVGTATLLATVVGTWIGIRAGWRR
jgi:peptide/nickel transport system permease protein